MQPLQQAAEQAGITNRQAYYWASNGWLEVLWFDRAGEPTGESGQGFTAWIVPREVERLKLMARLVRVGFQPRRARELAAASSGLNAIALGEGLHLWIEEPANA